MPVDYFITQYVSRGAGQMGTTINSLANGYSRLETAAMRSQRIGGAMATVGAIGVVAMTNLAKSSLQAAGEVSRVEVGYRTMLKNEQKVRELSKGVRDFDIKSPFSYLDSAKASQMLLAAGFRSDLLPTMYAVGNATVAAGKGTDTFVRALAIMAKIKTQGTLTAVRVNQFAAAGINVKDILKQKLGLTDEQMVNIGRLHLKADVVIPALIEGMSEKFKGGLEKAASQYLGSLETLQGAEDKFKASVGKSIEKDATRGVKALTDLTNAASDWTALHPRMTKMALAMGFVGSLALGFMGLRKAIAATRLITEALTAVTAKDIVVERIKTGVAGEEAVARNAAAAAAGRQAAAGRALTGGGAAGAGMPMLPAAGGAAGAAEAGASTGAAGAGAGAAEGAGAAAAVGFAAKFRALMGRQLFSDKIIGSAYERGLSPLSTAGQRLGSATVGEGLGAMATGAFAGYAAYDSLSNKENQSAIRATTGVNVSDTGAKAAGIGLGVGIAALTIVAPEVMVPLLVIAAATKAASVGIDKLYSDKLARASNLGSGAENTDVMGAGMNDRLRASEKARDHAAQAKVFDEMSLKSKAAGDDVSAQTFALQAKSQREIARREQTSGSPEFLARREREAEPGRLLALERAKAQQTPEAIAAYRQQQQERFAYMQANGQAPTGYNARGQLAYNTPGGATLTPTGAAQNTQTRTAGGTTVVRVVQEFVLAPGPGDEAARKRRSNTMTPAPV